ncbi:MAG: hypothetical protein PHI73_04135 [Patescibacteria group bacterium]|nr:hypothetical protein [Patescibacteria group bacterium]
MNQKKSASSPVVLILSIILLTVFITGCGTNTTKTNANNSATTTNNNATLLNACNILTAADASSAYGSPMQLHGPAEGIINEHDGTYKSYGCTYLTPDSTGEIQISIYRFGSSSAAQAQYDKWNGINSGIAVSGYGEAAYWGQANAVFGAVRGSDYIEVIALVGHDGNQDKAQAAMTTILRNLK